MEPEARDETHLKGYSTEARQRCKRRYQPPQQAAKPVAPAAVIRLLAVDTAPSPSCEEAGGDERCDGS